MKPHHPLSNLGPAFLALALALGMTACTLPSEKGTSAAAEVSEPFSDEEILQVLQTLNEGETRQAKLALSRSGSQDVRDTAQLIIKDHRELEERIRGSNTDLEESPLSDGMRLQAEEIHQELADLSSPEFDCTYLERQIEQHRIAVETVSTQLKPDARSAAVRAILDDAQSALEEHEQMAHQAHSSASRCRES